MYAHPLDMTPLVDMSKGKVVRIDLPYKEAIPWNRVDNNYHTSFIDPASTRQDIAPLNITQPDVSAWEYGHRDLFTFTAKQSRHLRLDWIWMTWQRSIMCVCMHPPHNTSTACSRLLALVTVMMYPSLACRGAKTCSPNTLALVGLSCCLRTSVSQSVGMQCGGLGQDSKCACRKTS